MRPLVLACVTLGLVATAAPLSSAPRWRAIPADTANHTGGSDLSAAVDSLVASRMEADRIPGAAVAFVIDGALVHAGGYGVADVSTGRPVHFDETVWRIGSVTKALTGLALAALAERDEIDLSADVSRWLDPGPLAGPLAAGPTDDPIRIRNLLTTRPGSTRRVSAAASTSRLSGPPWRPSSARSWSGCAPPARWGSTTPTGSPWPAT